MGAPSNPPKSPPLERLGAEHPLGAARLLRPIANPATAGGVCPQPAASETRWRCSSRPSRLSNENSRWPSVQRDRSRVPENVEAARQTVVRVNEAALVDDRVIDLCG